MSDKMTIEKAREIEAKGLPTYIGPKLVDYTHAQGFIEGWESRDAEVEKLKKEIEMYDKIFERHGIQTDLEQEIMLREVSK